MRNVEKKMAIGFIVYQPESSFYRRLEKINGAKLTTFVYDNSPEMSKTKELISCLPYVHYFSSGKNVGLGLGLYEICRNASQKNFESLLFFDQDTKFNLETISFIEKIFITNKEDLEKNYSSLCFSGAQEVNQGNSSTPLYLDVDLTINSGSLFFLKNLKRMGWHNPTYFVDGVDYEFCLRSHIAGFKIGKFFNTPYFDHETEQPDDVVTILGKRILIRKYSTIRVKDGFRSYIRLIYSSVIRGQFKFTFLFFRSFLIYIFGQVMARILR